MSKVPITARGAQELKEKLRQFKAVDRPRISAAIAEARAHGDLSENAEYHAAREQQSFLEGRIAAIEKTLADAKIIEISESNATGKIVFGVTVDLVNIENEETLSYQIVGELEADIERLRISITSPLARALIGKQEEDIVTVNAPGGTIEYKVTGIRYE